MHDMGLDLEDSDREVKAKVLNQPLARAFSFFERILLYRV